MTLETTDISGIMILKPTIIKDDRGYFIEIFKEETFLNSIGLRFVQDNQSYSKKNVIRGLHYQTSPRQQAKLVRCIHGEILDVALDLRYKSPTYGKHFTIKLSGENNLQLFIPKGFAHGFSVLSEEAIVSYKTSDYYSKENDKSICPLDMTLGINWAISNQEAILSEKDKFAPLFFKDVTL